MVTVQLDAQGVIASRVRLRRHYIVLCLMTMVPFFWHTQVAETVALIVNGVAWLASLTVLSAEIRGLRRDYDVMTRHRDR
jgi:uncharacterized membrane protein YagU involved in acid resistance